MLNKVRSERVCFVQVMKRVSHIKRGAQSENIWEQNTEKNIGLCDGKFRNFYCLDDEIHEENVQDFGRKIRRVMPRFSWQNNIEKEVKKVA
jgi:hypothetical protein